MPILRRYVGCLALAERLAPVANILCLVDCRGVGSCLCAHIHADAIYDVIRPFCCNIPPHRRVEPDGYELVQGAMRAIVRKADVSILCQECFNTVDVIEVNNV